MNERLLNFIELGLELHSSGCDRINKLVKRGRHGLSTNSEKKILEMIKAGRKTMEVGDGSKEREGRRKSPASFTTSPRQGSKK